MSEYQERYVGLMPLGEIKAAKRNPKMHDGASIQASIEDHGVAELPLIDERTGRLVAGHGRRGALQKMKTQGAPPPRGVQLREDGEWMVPILRGWSSKDDDEAEKYLLASNKLVEAGGWAKQDLAALIADLSQRVDLTRAGYGQAELQAILAGLGQGPRPPSPGLRDRFLVPPFSILDARQGYWQDRKRAWLAIGIKSEVGRGDNLLAMSDTALEPDPVKREAAAKKKANAAFLGQDLTAMRDEGKGAMAKDRRRAAPGKGQDLVASGAVGDRDFDLSGEKGQTGTSIFDPVLCELAYRWFSPKHGLVLDPFAGGSVRGIVAGLLERNYHGVDLRAEQVAANREQARQILNGGDPGVAWYEGDSRAWLKSASCPPVVDFVFSCPPYADLERYSDDPRDLSTMDYDAFLKAYREIIAAAAGKLRANRFACFVVGDVRAPGGNYRNFVSETISAFAAAGAALYNEMVLVTSVGSLSIRVGRQFVASRKVGKAHQNVLVFLKGDAKKATEACGQVEVAFPEAMGDAAFGEELA